MASVFVLFFFVLSLSALAKASNVVRRGSGGEATVADTLENEALPTPEGERGGEEEDEGMAERGEVLAEVGVVDVRDGEEEATPGSLANDCLKAPAGAMVIFSKGLTLW